MQLIHATTLSQYASKALAALRIVVAILFIEHLAAMAKSSTI